tara:strand:- start:66 stop:866 length:801 start_codon:yes stop_codon:yes gene_type:complete
MQTIVINLESASSRRAFMTRQLQALNLPYSFSTAVTPANIPEKTLRTLSLNWERPLKDTEVACFLSHAAVWQSIAASQVPILVLEDDAILSKRLPTFLKSAEALNEIDHLSLEVHYKKKWLGRRIDIGLRMSIAKMHLDRSGAAAYILWPSGAQRLIDRVASGEIALADAFMANEAAWRSYQADPVMALQTEVATLHGVRTAFLAESIIQAQRLPHEKTMKAPWHFKYMRLVSQWRIGVRKLKVLGRVTPRWPTVVSADFDRMPGI